ncbi:MAG TPA: pitrilysin family protein [Longimicrobiaceae bacterium]|jgi:zinc protease|nr:pitrilysin family protein [Longimicrobiaceae bacterium]
MKRLVPLLALLAAPVAAQEVSIPHTTFTLPNGLTVIVSEDHSTPIVAVNTWYHVGSGYERTGRTGFAHLFEHVMFEGSRNVPEGQFDNLLESAGGNNNGTTNNDRTAYYETLPSNGVELALWLEADRMGGLLDALNQQKLDAQRDVVKNERRQRVENQPYGTTFETAAPALYPAGHPYSWTTIGSMEDLTAASLDDVKTFFRTYYAPNNAVLSVVGDVNTADVRRMVERYFGGIPRGADVPRPAANAPAIAATRHIVKEDQVTLPELSLIWRTGPRFSRDEAALNALGQILTGGKSSRLYKRLVYDEQVAQNTNAFNDASMQSGDFWIQVRGKQTTHLDRMEAEVMEEIAKIAATPPSADELQRVVNGIQTSFVGNLETVLGKADQLNDYQYYAGDPGFAARDLARYTALTPADIQRVAREYLTGKNHIVLSYVPQGHPELAAGEKEAAR